MLQTVVGSVVPRANMTQPTLKKIEFICRYAAMTKIIALD